MIYALQFVTEPNDDGEYNVVLSIKQPAYGSYEISYATLYEGGRNAEGNFVGDKINTKVKLSVSWTQIRQNEWAPILNYVENNPTLWILYYDSLKSAPIVKQFYAGDRTGQVMTYDNNTGQIVMYSNCSCNFIEI